MLPLIFLVRIYGGEILSFSGILWLTSFSIHPLKYFFFTFTFFFLQVAPVNIIVGSHVWVEHPELAWVDGEVFKISAEEVHVHTTNGQTVSWP